VKKTVDKKQKGDLNMYATHSLDIYLSFSYFMKSLLRVFAFTFLLLANCLLLVPYLVFIILLQTRTNRSGFIAGYDEESAVYYQ
jgi:hypothetical protein